MATNEKGRERRGYVSLGLLQAGHDFFVYQNAAACSPNQPVRIQPYDASDAPPEWAIGTRVRHKNRPTSIEAVDSECVRWSGGWWFLNDEGVLLECKRWEPIPPVATVTLRVRGTPEKIEALRNDASLLSAAVFAPAGLVVEVIE